MTTRPDGGNDCDSCGRDVGAASLLQALHVGDIDPHFIGQVRNLRFCRRRPDDAADFVPCAEKLLDGMLDHYDKVTGPERAEAAERPEPTVAGAADASEVTPTRATEEREGQ